MNEWPEVKFTTEIGTLKIETSQDISHYKVLIDDYELKSDEKIPGVFFVDNEDEKKIFFPFISTKEQDKTLEVCKQDIVKAALKACELKSYSMDKLIFIQCTDSENEDRFALGLISE